MRHVPFTNRVGLVLVVLAMSLSGSAAATDVLAVVSAGNPVTTLSRNQAVDIFLGRANRFPDGRPAVAIDQVEGSPARDAFYAGFAGMSPAQVKAHWSKIIFTGRGLPPRAVASSIEVRKRIAEDPHAIGYVEAGVVDHSLKVLFVD